ncbi:MAG: nitroreductase [Methylophaga sp.]|nr:nitroreductase [Methylophaga sp.]
MNVFDAIRQRHSTRAFIDKDVAIEKINRILDIARYSPSGANTQPWQVAVVSGDSKNKLQSTIERAFQSGEPSQISYKYYPVNWKPIYKERRQLCGLQLYQSLGIQRADSDARKAQWAANYRCFDAPIMLLFFIDKEMETGSFLDYGMLLQSIMLAAIEEGLATCPQAALAEYPQIVQKALGYSDDMTLICGMALGYEDLEADVNKYRTPRESVDNFTQYFD